MKYKGFEVGDIVATKQGYIVSPMQIFIIDDLRADEYNPGEFLFLARVIYPMGEGLITLLHPMNIEKVGVSYEV